MHAAMVIVEMIRDLRRAISSKRPREPKRCNPWRTPHARIS